MVNSFKADSQRLPSVEKKSPALPDGSNWPSHADQAHQGPSDQRPRVLFTSAYPKTDSHGWHGPENHIAKALRATGLAVDFVGVEIRGALIGLRARQWVESRFGRRVQIEREPAALARIFRQ